MLSEKVAKYYDIKYDLNCAEAILYGANENYNLNLSKDALKTMAGFGGGMAIEETCGAITGGIAALSIMFVKDRGHEGEKIKNMVKELFERVQQKLGTTNCKLLKEKYRKDDETKCKFIVMSVAEIIQDMIDQELK